jgi:hypothetical protein
MNMLRIITEEESRGGYGEEMEFIPSSSRFKFDL